MFNFLKKSSKHILIAAAIVTAMMAVTASAESYQEVSWPDSELAAMIPAVGENGTFVGEVKRDRPKRLSIIVADTDQNGFDEYVSGCEDLGFTVDYHSSSGSYRADNAEGYRLRLKYNEDENTMNILLRTPSNKISDTAETDQTEEAEQETVADDQIRPEFKEAMDSYEAFFDEYVDFMNKYEESDSSISMLADYANYLSQYADMVDKMDELGEEDMTTAELVYYTEVTARITQKLASVSAQ